MTTPTAGPVAGPAPERVGDSIALLAFFVAALAASVPVLYLLAASGLVWPAPGTCLSRTKPVLTFGSVTLSGTTAAITVVDVSLAVHPSCYRFNLQANGVSGSAQNLGASGIAVSIAVANVTYVVTYVDLGGDGTVNGGDGFSVRDMRAGTQYTFHLLWSDGSQVSSRSWMTP